MNTPLVQLEKISKYFGDKKQNSLKKYLQNFRITKKTQVISAVDEIDLSIFKGEVVGLVGESGCGKSTLGRIMAGIYQPSSGNILINGINTELMSKKVSKENQLSIQMIFQDPYSSLNPRLRVDKSVGEAALIHGIAKSKDIDNYVSAQLEKAGLSASYRKRFPHQFSGGQRQRIGIARALSVQPNMLICDEAVAALDVSIQAQIINLFMDLRDDLNLTYLFISHDLSVVQHFSDRVAIMYLGRIIEIAPKTEIFKNANHPYTRALLTEIPHITDRKKSFSTIKGEVPSPLNPPSGCHFHPRCPHAITRCKEESPKLKEISSQHHSACHLNEVVTY